MRSATHLIYLYLILSTQHALVNANPNRGAHSEQQQQQQQQQQHANFLSILIKAGAPRLYNNNKVRVLGFLVQSGVELDG